MVSTYISGLLLGFSLILAIGAQNAFVLKQGLLKQHVFWVCLVCALSDAVLICFGVFGFASILSQQV
ncbi:MAG: LysE family transporter, partial [Acinetobacter sp.]|nr:LysE family transporter [Acinetobacter sp.]